MQPKTTLRPAAPRAGLWPTVRCALAATAPVMAGYLVLGIGFGMLLYAGGYSAWWALLMSLVIFAGSMQYVAVGLLTSGAGLLAAALMTLMVNARHLFYGISMVSEYKGMGWRKPYLIFGLTDETYSLVCGHPALPAGVDRAGYYFWVTLLDQCYWVAGSVLGSVLGSTLHLPTAGVDFAMTALFVVIFIEQWQKAATHLPAGLGLAVSIACLLAFGADNFLIPSMLGITAGLFLLRGRIQAAQAKAGEGVRQP